MAITIFNDQYREQKGAYWAIYTCEGEECASGGLKAEINARELWVASPSPFALTGCVHPKHDIHCTTNDSAHVNFLVNVLKTM